MPAVGRRQLNRARDLHLWSLPRPHRPDAHPEALQVVLIGEQAPPSTRQPRAYTAGPDTVREVAAGTPDTTLSAGTSSSCS